MEKKYQITILIFLCFISLALISITPYFLLVWFVLFILIFGIIGEKEMKKK